MRGQDTKAKILKQSIRLFGEKGYERVPIREIAASVGIKESSIYNHYTSKDEILDEIMDYFQRRHRSFWPAKQAFLDSLESGKTLSQTMRLFLYEYPEEDAEEMLLMFRILFMEQYRNERLKELRLHFLMDDQLDFMVSVFELLIKEGYLYPFDCWGLARVWNSTLIIQAQEACHVGRENTTPQPIYDICISLVMQYATDKGLGLDQYPEFAERSEVLLDKPFAPPKKTEDGETEIN